MTKKCLQCGICCSLFLINLTKKEYYSGEYKTQFKKLGLIKNFPEASSCGANLVQTKKDGSCVYLQENKCSIHSKRPQVCKEFFCNSKEPRFKNMITQIKIRQAERKK